MKSSTAIMTTETTTTTNNSIVLHCHHTWRHDALENTVAVTAHCIKIL